MNLRFMQRKKLYTDEERTGLGEISEKNRNQKEEWRDGATTVSDLYPSTCLTSTLHPV